MHLQLNDHGDTFIWSLQQRGTSTICSVYQVLAASNIVPHNHATWKLKLLLRIKIFLWHLSKGIVLTKDNLSKQHWKGSLKCYFYTLDENLHHLFFYCHIDKFIWRIVQISFNLTPPSSIHHIFGDWLQGIIRNLSIKSWLENVL